MSRDIKNYEPKVIGPLTMRQIVCLLISLSYGIPIFFLITGDIVVRILIAMMAMVPVLLCGWLKVYDEPFEKFIKIVIINKFFRPVKRKYVIKNEYTNPTPQIKKIKRSKQIKGYK